MPEKTKCLDCEHFDQKADESLYPDAGLCRASTPIMANSSNVWGRWPAVNSNDWCGKAAKKDCQLSREEMQEKYDNYLKHLFKMSEICDPREYSATSCKHERTTGITRQRCLDCGVEL